MRKAFRSWNVLRALNMEMLLLSRVLWTVMMDHVGDSSEVVVMGYRGMGLCTAG